MVKKTILVLLLLLILPVVLAINTEINVKTLPNHEVLIKFADGSQIVENITENSDDKGVVSATFSSNKYSKIKIFIQINKDRKKVLFENFGLQSLGEPLYFQVMPNLVSEDPWELEPEELNETEEQNQTAETPVAEEANETEEQNQTGETESGITGSAILDKNTWLSSRTTVWIAGIIIVIAIIIILIARMTLTRNSGVYLPKVQNVKPSFLPKPKTPIDKELEETEHEIEDVRSRIERIRKIKEAQKKLKIEQEELKRLEKN